MRFFSRKKNPPLSAISELEQAINTLKNLTWAIGIIQHYTGEPWHANPFGALDQAQKRLAELKAS